MKTRHAVSAAARSVLVEGLESRRLFAAAPTMPGLTPQDVRELYGFDDVRFGNIVGDGAGQTIAIITAFDHPGFVDSTDPNYANSDLAIFNRQFGLPDAPFEKVGSTETAPPFANLDSWSLETALDVQWAHAIAPKAKILLYVAGNENSVVSAVRSVVSDYKPSVVSMSFGAYEDYSTLSDYFLSGQKNPVTYVAGSGDDGRPAFAPSISPTVLSVGGTTVSSVNGKFVETGAWSGSGGGYSSWYSAPSWQKRLNTSNDRRMAPDVSMIADPNLGVHVYDSGFDGGTGEWQTVGGTSVGAPIWSGFMAMVNQGRALAGKHALDGPTETLPGLYSAPASAFRDITTGNNGFAAGTGYDLVTGLGSPNAPVLAQHLVGYGTNASAIIGSGGGPMTEGMTVYLDTNRNNRLDTGETSTVADSGGVFRFNNRSRTDTQYVRFVAPAKVQLYSYVNAGATGPLTYMTVEATQIVPAPKASGLKPDFNDNFDGDGVVKLDNVSITDLVAAPDGGWYQSEVRVLNNRYEYFVRKFNANGTPDTRYGDNGYARIGAAPDGGMGGRILLASDGTLYTAYNHQTALPSPVNGVLGRYTTKVLRLLPSGDLDPTFGTGGEVVLTENGFELGAMAFDRTGALFVMGNVHGSARTPDASKAYLWKLNRNGTLDTSFGNQGVAWVGPIVGSSGRDIKFDSKNRPVILGNLSTSHGFATLLMRLNTNGTLDTSYGYGGWVQTFNGWDAPGLLLDAQDRAIVVTHDGPIYIGRFTDQGRFDKSFGVGGFVKHNLVSTGSIGRPVLLSDGSVLMPVTSIDGWTDDGRSGLLHFNADGSVDTAFGPHGRLYRPGASTSPYPEGPRHLVQLANGSYLSSSATYGEITRLFNWTLNPTATTTGSISGSAFNDTNADGLKNGSETFAGGKVVYLDANNNGKLDAGEKQTTTASNGSFAFAGLAAGTYRVRRVFPSGYTYSTALIDLNLAAGQKVTGLTIGSRTGSTPPPPVTPTPTTGSIRGYAFNDTDKNGLKNGTETFAGGKVVFLDANNDGKWTTGEKQVTTAADGSFAFTGLSSGTYRVRRVFPSGYTYSTKLIDLVLTSGQNVTGVTIGSKTL